MKKIHLIAYMILSVVPSCGDDELYECVINQSSFEELTILKTSIDEADEYTYFMKATYYGEDVFYNRYCNPTANYQSNVYNCDGILVGGTNELMNELTDIELLWKHPQVVCTNFN